MTLRQRISRRLRGFESFVTLRRLQHEGWNNAESNRALAEFLKGRGVPVTTREVSEGFAWGSWRNRADLVFGRLFS